MFSLRRLRLRYCNEYSCEVAVGILKQRLFGPWHMVCGFDSQMGWSSVVCCYRPAGAPRSCGLSKRSGGPLSSGWTHGMGLLVTYYIVISPSLPYLVSISFLGRDSIALLGLCRKVLMVGPVFLHLEGPVLNWEFLPQQIWSRMLRVSFRPLAWSCLTYWCLVGNGWVAGGCWDYYY